MRAWHIIFILLILIIPVSYAKLSCSMSSACTHTEILHLSNFTNAHSEIKNYSYYTEQKICCYDSEGSAITNICNGTGHFRLFSLSNGTNAHADLTGDRSYPIGVCINTDAGWIECGYKSSCSGFDTCVASISKYELGRSTSLHIGSCTLDPYTIKVCCSIDRGYTVKFVLDMKIADNDIMETESNSTGFFRQGDMNHYYTCIENPGLAETPTFGMLFSGNKIFFMNATEHRVEMKQAFSGNSFIIPITRHNCTVIENRTGDLDTFGIITRPFVAFMPFRLYPTEILLSYPGIDLVGDFSKSGAFDIVLERNESETSQIIIYAK